MALCYRDMTFCASDCINTDCTRHFGEAEREGSRLWWNHDPDNAPIAVADFSDVCEHYKKGETE
jgi:hypothetical protein